MAAKKGQNLRVFIGTKAVALALNCTVNVNAETEDDSTKDSTSSWANNVPTGASWDISFESQYKDTDTAAQTFASLKTLATGMTKTAVLFDAADGTNNRTAQSAAYSMNGYAYVSQLTLQADNRQTVTISGTLTGTGPLQHAAVTA